MTGTPPEALDKAVSEGVITGAQAEAIRQIAERDGTPDLTVAGSGGAPEKARDEPFVLINNFGDIFLCFGLIIIYNSKNFFTGALGIAPFLTYAAFAVLFWVLTEVFVFKAHRKSPAALSAFMFIWLAFQSYSFFSGESVSVNDLARGALNGQGILVVMNVLFIVTLVRFRLPILMLGLALGFPLLVFSIAMQHVDPLSAFTLLALCGAVLLVAGVYLDRKDRTRTGLYHEYALWLFFVGSPLLVHGVMLFVLKDHMAMFFLGARSGNPDLLVAQLGVVIWTVSALAFVFTLMGLILDRRSLVSSSLLYIAAVLLYVTYQSGAGFTLISAIVPFSIGLLVIVLGLIWDPVRDFVLRFLPCAGWFRPPSKA